jgi:hypothetical protein
LPALTLDTGLGKKEKRQKWFLLGKKFIKSVKFKENIMAALSDADKTYTTALADLQKSAIEATMTYLKAGPADRRANITDSARDLLASAANCCCGGIGCACCVTGCCYDGCCFCKSGCGCNDNADSTAVATS